jgi:hypothetical protein
MAQGRRAGRAASRRVEAAYGDVRRGAGHFVASSRSSTAPDRRKGELPVAQTRSTRRPAGRRRPTDTRRPTDAVRPTGTRRSIGARCSIGLVLAAVALLALGCSGDDQSSGSSTTITTASTTTSASATSGGGSGQDALAQAIDQLCTDLSTRLPALGSSISNLSVADLQSVATTLGRDLQRVQQAATTSTTSRGSQAGQELSQAVTSFNAAGQSMQNALTSLLATKLDDARIQAQQALDQLNSARQHATRGGVDSCNTGNGTSTTTSGGGSGATLTTPAA